MRFEIQYPSGVPHEVELQGSVAVIGRDPSCNLVLSDAKCSRRHAVLEAGPQGIAIRDTGSANGVYVNGKKVERAQLAAGDVVRLGDVTLKVLPEEVSGTVVMAADDMDLRTASLPRGVPPAPGAAGPGAPPGSSAPAEPRPGMPPVAASGSRAPGAVAQGAAPASSRPAGEMPTAPLSVPPRPAAARPRKSSAAGPRRAGGGRPPTVTLLAVLWLISLPLYAFGGYGLARAMGAGPLVTAGLSVLGLTLALLGGVMAYGLWRTAGWARLMQIGIACLGLLVCPFTIASALVIAYMLRPSTRASFEGLDQPAAEPGKGTGPPGGDGAFAAAILGALLFGLALLAAGAFFTTRARGGRLWGQGPSEEAPVVSRLHAVAAAQAALRKGTCNDGYTDLDGLTNPSSVIPNYPPEGPRFLAPEFREDQALGYRFTLTVSDPVPSGQGCLTRGFRRFVYSASPVTGEGRHFLVAGDGVVRVADGRPATPSDPAVN